MSKYVVGSSNKIKAGLPIKEIATDNFLLLPPLKVKHILFLFSVKDNISIKDKHVFTTKLFFIPLRRAYNIIVSKTVI